MIKIRPSKVNSMKENDLIQVNKIRFVRGIDGNESVNITPNDLFSIVGGITLGNLPNEGINKVANHDGSVSRYGYYNNTADTTGEYAPASSAGIFIRISTTHAKVTFFFPSASGAKKLWYRIDGSTCIGLT